MSRVTGIRMEQFNPFLRIKANPKKFSPEYLEQISSFAGVVTGLALREAGMHDQDQLSLFLFNDSGRFYGRFLFLFFLRRNVF